MNPGDLVVIRNPDVIESFVMQEPVPDELLYGVAISFEFEDPDDPKDDVWIVLVNDQLYKMLRWEFDPVKSSSRSRIAKE